MTEAIQKNIKELFSESGVRYEIPVYQRDYAWTESQICQLIQDIADYAKETPTGNYYIGTLVVHPRTQGNQVVYETIDGQQRLTTLVLLSMHLQKMLKLLPKNEQENVNLDWFKGDMLSFACRPKSTEALKRLGNEKANIENAELNTSILQGYQVIERSLPKILAEKELNEKIFVKYLGKHVCILRVPVPNDTDLNHYFEIMNSRGEQLEMHEILKARCLECLKDEKERVAFHKIWEAASDMNHYMQYGFTAVERDTIFGNGQDELKWNVLESKERIYEALKGESENSDTKPLEELAKPENLSKDMGKQSQENEDDGNAPFHSIINFSNFLLHVLRIYAKRNNVKEDIPLDDKRLLETFGKFINPSNEKANPEVTNSLADKEAKRKFVKQFGYDLLKLKFLFDKYIIKREFDNGKEQWSLKRIRCYNKSNSYIGTFGKEESFETGADLNREVLMLLSMFHVSAPTLAYKHWLNGALMWLSEQPGNISGEVYKTYLEKMARSFFRDRFLSTTPIDYNEIIYTHNCETQYAGEFNESALNRGTGVENFVFNYLDYLLWKDYKGLKEAFCVLDGEGKEVKIEEKDIATKISGFEFTFRSSVEHFYPQHPINGKELAKEACDNFGNLCLISSEKNSRLSNYMPSAKKEHYKNASRIDSIKQCVMMQYTNWTADEIEHHYRKMVEIFNNNLKEKSHDN